MPRTVRDLVQQMSPPRNIQGDVLAKITRVNYVNRRVQVQATGYAGPKSVRVSRSVALGTVDLPKVFAGDYAILNRSQQDGRWICTAIRNKALCPPSALVEPVVEVEGGELEVDSLSNSWQANDFGLTLTPLDLFFPPIEPLGQLSLQGGRWDTLCGIPLCQPCATPVAGQALVYDSALGCLKWDFRSGGQGLVWILYSAQDIYRIDTLVAAAGTSTSLPAWDVTYSSGHFGNALTPANSNNLNLYTFNLVTPFPDDAAHSADGGVTYTFPQSLLAAADQGQIEKYLRQDIVTTTVEWISTIESQIEGAQEFQGQVSEGTLTSIEAAWSPGPGTYADSVFENYNKFYANEFPLVVWWTTNAGLTWTSAQIGYACQVGSIRVFGPGAVPGVVNNDPTYTITDDSEWRLYRDIGDAGFQFYVAATWTAAVVAPRQDGEYCYVVAALGQGALGFDAGGDESIDENTVEDWYWAGSENISSISQYYSIIVALVRTNGTVDAYREFLSPYMTGLLPDYVPVRAVANPMQPHLLAIVFEAVGVAVQQGTKFGVYDYTADTFTDKTANLALGGNTIVDLRYAVDGTLYAFVSGNKRLRKSDDDGDTFSTIDLSTGIGVTDVTIRNFFCITSDLIVVVPLTDGRFAFSSDEGASWNITAVLGLTSSILSVEGL